MNRTDFREIMGVLTLLIGGGMFYAFVPDFWQFLPAVNIVLSATLGLILGTRIWSLVREDQRNLFAPFLWFRASTLVYFAFGNMVPYILKGQSYSQIRMHYDFTDLEVLKFNLVVLLGVLTILTALALTKRPLRRLLPALIPVLKAQGSKGELLEVALVFLIVGGTFRYGVLMAHLLGTTDFVLPGVLRNLAFLYHAGLFLLVFLALRMRGPFVIAAAALVPIELLTGVATLAKIEVMLTAMFVWLAFLLHRLTSLRLAGGLAAMTVLFATVVPTVDFGRQLMFQRYGNLDGGTLEVRFQFLQQYLQSDVSLYQDDQAKYDRIFRRLSYIDVSPFLVDRYDDGLPGDTYADAAIVLVPRALWPDKPNLAQQGKDLAYMFSGSTMTSTGSGMFAEAYWNFGWTGVVLGMALYGLMMSILSELSLIIMRQQLWALLPVVLTGVKWGARVDGRMAQDGVGAFGLSLVLLVLMIGMRSVLRMLMLRRADGPLAA